MSPDMILLISFGIFFALLLASAPVAFSLAASGAVGITLLRSANQATATLGNTAFQAPADYNLSVIPMYILLGMLAVHGQLAARVFKLASIALGRLPGGLGVATVAACAGFSAVSGSSLATAASLGKLSVGEMRRYGYLPSFAAGIVAAAGTLGVLIPPSVLLVMYSVIAEESITRVLAAGIIPGILSFLLVGVYVMMRAGANVTVPQQGELVSAVATLSGTVSESRNARSSVLTVKGASVASSGGSGTGGFEGSNGTEPGESRIALFRALAWIAAIFTIIIAGTFTGLFTIVESAAFGAFTALIMVFVEVGRRGNGRTILKKLYESLMDSASTTSMAFGLMIGAAIFSVFLVMTRAPMRLSNWVTSLDVPPTVVVILILVMLIPLGMFLDAFAIIIIVAPLVHPIIVELGFNGIWFAILFTVMIEIGMITPPVGMNAFVVSTATGVKLEETFKGLLPFVGLQLLLVVILLMVPDLVTWLPNLIE